MNYIPYARQYIDQDDIDAVINVLRSDYLTTGPCIEEFEKEFARYVHAKYAVAVSSGTAALHAACFAAGIRAGDEVITTPLTFAASANAVLYMGGKPVFADIDPCTYNIAPQDIRKNINDKTKAVIPVHYTGQPCDMDEITKIAEEHNLMVIEDAAHALGAVYKNRRVGGISHMTIFSFHPVKHITTGEGGMITTNDEELYKRLMLFRTHGITRDPRMMLRNQGGWYYEQLELGHNYRITDMQAALGVSQLKKADMFIQRRKEIVRMYNDAFRESAEIITPFQLADCGSSWHLYVIQLKSKNRKEVFDNLRARGIGVNVHYIPVYTHPYYRENGYGHVTCANSERLYGKIISVPLFFGLKDDEVAFVIESVLAAVG